MKQLILLGAVVVATAMGSRPAVAGDGEAFKVYGKSVSMDDVSKEQKGEFYEIEKRKYDIVEHMAHERYLKEFWEKKAAESNTSVEGARKAYFDKNVKIASGEVKAMIDKYKSNEQFAKFSKEEQERQITDFLKDRASRNVEFEIIQKAIKAGDLAVVYPQPKEPVYDIKLSDTDITRFGPGGDDVKPMGCDRKSCPVTIVEYSEFQCPYCSKVVPTTKRILSEYKGKLSWTTRDFPLSFHDRARPAAVAAHCAADQGKFWHMYSELFANQGALDDESLKKYAAKVVTDKGKWDECFKNPGAKYPLIDANIESGMKVGITGTPGFFINGRRISGALPYEEFKRIIDDEISKGKKS